VSLVLVGSSASLEMMDERVEAHYSETAQDIGRTDLSHFAPPTTTCGVCPTTTTTTTTTTTSNYKLLGSVLASNGNDNSFDVTVDGLPSGGYLWDTSTAGGYHNDHVADRDGMDPVTVWLTAGSHTVTLHHREDGTFAESLQLVAV
jgi:hypothetical protein